MGTSDLAAVSSPAAEIEIAVRSHFAQGQSAATRVRFDRDSGVEEWHDADGRLLERIVRTYGPRGLAEERRIAADGRVVQTTVVEHGADGVTIHHLTRPDRLGHEFVLDGVHYGAPEAVRQRIHYRAGTLQRVEFLDASDALVGTLAVENDDGAQPRKAVLTLLLAIDPAAGERVPLAAVETEYVRETRREELTTRMQGRIVSRRTTEFGDHGLPVRVLSRNPGGGPESTLSFTYQLNEKGDWIEQTTTAGDEVVSVVRRTITYRNR